MTRKTAETPRKKPWPLEERPGFLIRRLHQIHVALFMEACGEFDITPVQYSLLVALAARGRADQTTLAADIAMDRTTTAGALRRLATRGLLRRGVLSTDRRAQLCSLTPAGLALLADIETAARDSHERTLAGLEAAERATFLALLQRLVVRDGRVTEREAGLSPAVSAEGG